jgi:AraC-like DNA-binding protein
MMNGGKNVIYNSVSFIESRLSEDLNVNELAGQAFFSTTHYTRLFQAVIGQTVMEYIKMRRIKRAGIALCETSASILEIALEYGYTSHEGFIRAFKAHFGMPPNEYRKRYSSTKTKKYHEGVKNMTKESRKNIKGYIDEIAKEMSVSAAEIEKWNEPAQKAIEKDKRTTGGMKVAFTEWANLSSKINAAAHETKKIPDEAETVYDLYDKANIIMKVLDDIVFQMNLLRFFTGIERARMGEHGIPFDPILEGLTALCEAENKRKEIAIKLIVEVNALVQTEIKNEAVKCMEQSLGVWRETINEGMSLAEETNKMVIELGQSGRGFAFILKILEKGVSHVREAETFMESLSSETGKDNGLEFFNSNRNMLHTSLKNLQESAFIMNINAFNAAVETARSGYREDCVKCSDGIREYAGTIQRACKAFHNVINDCIKLMDMLVDKDENIGIRSFDKHLDDIIFQAGGMNSQMRLESERAWRDDFIALSKEFEDMLDSFINELQNKNQTEKTEALKKYKENVLTLIKRGNEVAKAAGDYGVGIAYILKEYNNYASQI